MSYLEKHLHRLPSNTSNWYACIYQILQELVTHKLVAPAFMLIHLFVKLLLNILHYNLIDLSTEGGIGSEHGTLRSATIARKESTLSKDRSSDLSLRTLP